MKKFKKGDKVIRTAASYAGVDKGEKYEVSAVYPDQCLLTLGCDDTLYSIVGFELASGQITPNLELTPHVHAKEIKAWADGHKIQFMGAGQVWHDTTFPTWRGQYKYRVAPDNSEEIARLEKCKEIAKVKVALEIKHFEDIQSKLAKLK